MEGHRSGARRAAVSAMSSDPDRAGSRARPGDTPRDRCIRSSAHRFSAPWPRRCVTRSPAPGPGGAGSAGSITFGTRGGAPAG